MGNVGSRLDDGSPLYLKDQTRCKRAPQGTSCASTSTDLPAQSSFPPSISPTRGARHCYAYLPTHSQRLGITHTKTRAMISRSIMCRCARPNMLSLFTAVTNVDTPPRTPKPSPTDSRPLSSCAYRTPTSYISTSPLSPASSR
jgi:hypothetical protein